VGWLDTLTAAVDELIGEDPDQPLIRATLDPRELVVPQDAEDVPAAWIKFNGLRGKVRLASGAYEPAKVWITVYVPVATRDVARTLATLQAHGAVVAATLPPMTEPRHVSLQLPAGGTPATALAYDHDLRIEE
jgi:hypothetical protein